MTETKKDDAQTDAAAETPQDHQTAEAETELPLVAEDDDDPVATDTLAGGREDQSSLEEQVADLKDRLLRALAENENTIRRARRDREDAAKYATANFARDMLTVADDLNRALGAIPDEMRDGEAAKAFLDGVELTGRELLSTLERHGIRKISPLGEKFNHDLHEALFEVPTADAEPGTVVQVVEDGYVIHDRLLRAARVGVAKAIAGPDGGEGLNVDTTA